MSEATESASLLLVVAEGLGEGWRAQPYTPGTRNDGHLFGPGGEECYADARVFGEWPGRNAEATLYLKQRVPRADDTGRVTIEGEGHTIADFIAAVNEALPDLEAAHLADVARAEAVMGPALAFAEEVAGYMEEGWTGGTEDSGRDRLQVMAYVENGDLRVTWRPCLDAYKWDTGASYPAAERLTIRGTRESSGHETGFYKANPEITAAAKRGPKAIASEITRRLLPGYIEAMQKADKEQARHEQALTDLAATVEKVRAAMPGVNLRDDRHAEGGESHTLGLYVNLSACDGSMGADLTVTPGSVTVALHGYLMPEEMFSVVLPALAGAITDLQAADSPED